MKPIQTYIDFREFLKDYYENRKKQNPSYSYRTFCLLAGIKNPSLFREVVLGRRNLTQKSMVDFAKGLKLGETDTRYFMALVHFNQAKSDREKQIHLEQMRGLRQTVDQKLVPARYYEYYSKWYHSVVREAAASFDWKENYALLAKILEPKIKTSEARESVKLLLDLGFLIQGLDGRYKQASPAITTGGEVMSLAVRKLNQELAGLGQAAIERFTPVERDITSVVVGVSGEAYTLIKREMKEFKRRVIQIVNDDKPAERVYNMNVQLFPLSEAFPENETACEILVSKTNQGESNEASDDSN